MKNKLPQVVPPLHHGRRRFVQGLAAGGVLAATPAWLRAGVSDFTSLGSAPVLTGRAIDLVVAETPVNFTGATQMATTINGSIPAPTLRFRQGDEVTIRVTNRLPVSTSIHWHGILLPFQMDGVPGMSFKGIAPGETFTYRFRLRQSGTYWYHSHTGFQEMTGMYGALIIEPHSGERHRADREHVVQLSDWAGENPMQVFSKLKVHSDIFNYNHPTLFDFTRDVSGLGLEGALEKRRMWNQMRMNPTDLADLSAATMTFLMNGTAADGNWTGLFKKGERVKLRFINSASNSFYDVRIPGLPMKVIQADGQDLEPLTVDEIRFGPGETYDVMVEPRDDAYTIFAQSMDRSGYARGTLATRPGLSAPVPELDPVEWLTMGDMMGVMDHGMMGMDHSAMQGGMTMDHSQHRSSAMNMQNGATMDHSQHGGGAMNMQNGATMDHSQHGGGTMNMQGGGTMDHRQHGGGMQGMNHAANNPLARPSSTVRHARTEYGPSVDMRVDMPRTNLDDPGIGLRDLAGKGLRPHGHRVLTLAGLKSIGGVLDDPRIPGREIELHLTGNMERYSWSFDGLEFGQSTPVSLRHKERVRIILQNDTMMTHPMHLHGMWSELETDQGELRVRRHTIPVQPAQRISFLTTPNDVGRWAWHCHLLFHMDGGMFREVVVS